MENQVLLWMKGKRDWSWLQQLMNTSQYHIKEMEENL